MGAWVARLLRFVALGLPFAVLMAHWLHIPPCSCVRVALLLPLLLADARAHVATTLCHLGVTFPRGCRRVCRVACWSSRLGFGVAFSCALVWRHLFNRVAHSAGPGCDVATLGFAFVSAQGGAFAFFFSRPGPLV